MNCNTTHYRANSSSVPGDPTEKKSFKRAELAAREQVQTIGARFEKTGWKEAVGSSGTARSIAEVLARNNKAERGINASGLAWLREALIEAGDLERVAIEGLREDRVPVVAGGVAVMSAVFAELALKEMTVAEGALRDGVLWDLLGRVHHRDIREVTVEQFTRRYHVDGVQAQRVRDLARIILRGLEDKPGELAAMMPFLDWAARLHEIGISIAQGAYHKHSAYILANADMPGFSRQEQLWLSNVALSQRGKLEKMRAPFADDARLALVAFSLRLAVIFFRSRRSLRLPRLAVSRKGKAFRLEIDARWLAGQSLIAVALEQERDQWESVGMAFEVVEG